MFFLVLLVAIFFNCSGQILKPVSVNDFRIKSTIHLKALTADTLQKSKWIVRLNTGLMGYSYPLKKGITPIALDAVGFGAGYLHYKLVNNIPFNDFGVNALFLKSTQDKGYGLGLYGTYNTGLANNLGLLNVGIHYDFVMKIFLVDTGLTFHF